MSRWATAFQTRANSLFQIPSRKRSIDLAITTAQLLIVVHLFQTHVLEVRPCAGASMYPTFSISGDYIAHSRLLLRFRPLHRGDLVTATSPLDPAHQVLKRVVGLEGDTVKVDPSGERGRGDEWCKVPKGHVWLAGDNMSNSTDSRDYGPVPRGLLRGIVFARLFPKMQLLSSNIHKE